MLPPAFIGQMQALLGSESEAFFDALLRQPAPPSIRLNPAKRAALPHAPAKAVPWCAHGFYLAQRPASFTLDPLLHAGAYYVQEASSMFIAHLARQLAGEAPLAALDLCAAPGGKATLLASCLPEGSL
ncbi:MAG: hypothetical protein LBS63_02225, partial [Prevotellaceae bacterium]|nr:hypothetical protein [Prevotellaceae bacterium]